MSWKNLKISQVSPERLEKSLIYPRELCNYFFRDEVTNKPLVITPMQEYIIKGILCKAPQRWMIWATTRYGKSLAIALGSILRCVFYPAEKVRLIAPTLQLAQIIKEYVDKHLVDHIDLVNSLSISEGNVTEYKLGRELSRKRITFNNNSEISVLSAGISNTGIYRGRGILGSGGSLIIVDEAESIPSNLINTHIIRMAGERSDSQIILVSNPIYKGFMYEHQYDQAWVTLRIGWETAVKDGRITRQFIDERKTCLTPSEFSMWYEARYPEDSENTLIRWDWIKRATNLHIEPGNLLFECVGVDPAGMGRDLTVMTHIARYTNAVVIKNIESWGKTEVMESSHRVANYLKTNRVMYACIDDTGLAGMTSVLRELLPDYSIIPINFGGKAQSIERANNMKAEIYLNLRQFFKDNEIVIPNHQVLRGQLNNILVEGLPSGKQRVLDGQSKSPDYSDSLALACWLKIAGEIEMGSVKLIR